MQPGKAEQPSAALLNNQLLAWPLLHKAAAFASYSLQCHLPDAPDVPGTCPSVPLASEPPRTGAVGRGISPLGMVMNGPGATLGVARGAPAVEVPSVGLLSEAPPLKPPLNPLTGDDAPP